MDKMLNYPGDIVYQKLHNQALACKTDVPFWLLGMGKVFMLITGSYSCLPHCPLTFLLWDERDAKDRGAKALVVSLLLPAYCHLEITEGVC